MVERKERVQLEPEGSIKMGSIRTFLKEMEPRFEPEKGFTCFFRGHSRLAIAFESFDGALAYLRAMPVAKWRRPNTNGNWGIVSTVRWGVLLQK